MADFRLRSLYNHYGYAPYWGAGYMYPLGLGGMF